MTAPLRLLWLVALPLEAAAGWFLLSPGLWRAAFAFALHAAAAGVFGLSLLVRVEERRVWAWPLLGWTLSLLAFPLLGMLAVAAAFALTRGAFRRSDRIADEIEDVVGSKKPSGDVVARARELEISLLEEREIEPIVDVLKEDDPELKRAAIEAITRQRGAGTVRLLRGLLHDPAPEARFFASVALARLEDEIGQSILSAQQALAADPDQPEARERLAQLYWDYALSGFLEGVTRDYYLDLALQAFDDALEVSPQPDRLALQRARVHLLLGEIVEAAVALDDLARRHPTDADVRVARMEVIYEFGDFRELSVYARRALPDFSGDGELRDLLEWWAEASRKEAPVDAQR
jgi:tetratricopeptide (TPR) repeat protein